jgi:hypothetical protein
VIWDGYGYGYGTDIYHDIRLLDYEWVPKISPASAGLHIIICVTIRERRLREFVSIFTDMAGYWLVDLQN